MHGLLGPNGAGKTTAVRILTTLLRTDGGSARSPGIDVRTQGREVRRRIGLVGQAAAVDDVLTGRQNLVLVGRLNHLDRGRARRRATELLQRFSLTEAADRKVARLLRRDAPAAGPGGRAGGRPAGAVRRRADDRARSQGRREVWSAIRELVGGGTTVLLTTQYLEEADQLADRITMLRGGVVVGGGHPRGAEVGNRRRLAGRLGGRPGRPAAAARPGRAVRAPATCGSTNRPPGSAFRWPSGPGRWWRCPPRSPRAGWSRWTSPSGGRPWTRSSCT